MRRKPKNGNKHRDWEHNYDLPKELDFRKLRLVGVGLDALKKHVESKRRVVQLEPDVARDFPSDGEVNIALRLVKQLQQIGKVQRRKSA